MGSKTLQNGKVAEWSKALALGASPKGRGFEPHLYQIFFLARLRHEIFLIVLPIYSMNEVAREVC